MSAVKDALVGRLVSGDPIEVGDTTIVPETRLRTLSFPFGGLVNSHPDGVLVTRQGETRRVPVVDETRSIRLGLMAGFLLLWMVFVISLRRRRSNGSSRR